MHEVFEAHFDYVHCLVSDRTSILYLFEVLLLPFTWTTLIQIISKFGIRISFGLHWHDDFQLYALYVWTLNFKMAFEELFLMLLPVRVLSERQPVRGWHEETLQRWQTYSENPCFDSFDGSTFTRNTSRMITVERAEVCGGSHPRLSDLHCFCVACLPCPCTLAAGLSAYHGIDSSYTQLLSTSLICWLTCTSLAAASDYSYVPPKQLKLSSFKLDHLCERNYSWFDTLLIWLSGLCEKRYNVYKSCFIQAVPLAMNIISTPSQCYQLNTEHAIVQGIIRMGGWLKK